jgi:hypothetical protein
MLVSTFLLGIASLAQADSTLDPATNFTVPGRNALMLAAHQSCNGSEVTLDRDYCIASDVQCCNTGRGSYCSEDFFCIDGGICYYDGEKSCGYACISNTSVCDDPKKICNIAVARNTLQPAWSLVRRLCISRSTDRPFAGNDRRS